MKFIINPISGQFYISNLLDRETVATYTLGIRTTDGTNTSALEIITINVGDVNDNAPVITPAQTFTIAENSATGSTVGTILATDADLSTTLSNWTITSGNTGTAFALNASTGELTLNNAIDRGKSRYLFLRNNRK